MSSSVDPREARKLAIVVTNFTFLLAYLAFAVAPGWRQVVALVAFGAGAMATAWCWYAAIRSRSAVEPPGHSPDPSADSN
jgi:protein-S-isoprenylcysteine O-methyltransferase Ste14